MFSPSKLSLLLLALYCVEAFVTSREKNCPEGMIHSQCGTACPRTCENPYSDICVPRCVEGCFCPSDKPILLDDGQTCGELKECRPKDECPGDTVMSNCASSCPPTCEHPIPVCTSFCLKDCACPREAPILLGEGKCGTYRDCPQRCYGDTVWTECASMCRPTCENPAPVCNEMCRKGCACPAQTPIYLGNGKCGVVENCPRKARDDPATSSMFGQ